MPIVRFDWPDRQLLTSARPSSAGEFWGDVAYYCSGFASGDVALRPWSSFDGKELTIDAFTSPNSNNSLRERMLQGMTMRGFGAHTQKDYIRHVRSFAAFLGRPPDTATIEDLRRFQIDPHERAVGLATINGAVSAPRFLLGITLKRLEMALGLVVARYAPKLRAVLSVEETARLLKAPPGIKYKAALSVAYGAGLHVSEVAHLKVDDIDSTRMPIRVEQGKGRKDRNAMLSPHLLNLLRQWWPRQAAGSDVATWLAVPRPQRHGSGLSAPVASRRAGSS